MKRDMQTTAKVLAALRGGGRQSILAITEQLGKGQASVYQVLRRLEEKGDVQRTPGDHGGSNPQLWYIPEGLSPREARRADKGLRKEMVKYKGLLEIESGIPIPPERASLIGFTAVLKRMKVGDSIVIHKVARGGQRYNAAKKLGMKIVSRLIDKDRVRVWRVK